MGIGISSIRSFAKCSDGNFAVIAAIAALPVIGMAGLALDYTRMVRAEQQLQAGVDAALFAAAVDGGTPAAMAISARNYITSNVEAVGIAVETMVDTHRLKIVAKYRLPLPVLAAFGRPDTEIAASGELTGFAPIRRTGIDGTASRQEFRAMRREFRRRLSKLSRYQRERALKILQSRMRENRTSAHRYYLSE